MKKTGMLAFLLFSALVMNGQEQGDFNVDLTFDNTTEVKEILAPIAPNVSDVFFHFSGKIKSGSLKVRILDPNGKKEGGFQLESLTRATSGKKGAKYDAENNTYAYSIVGDSNSSASGSMNKQVSKPLQGLWKVEITAAGVTGVAVCSIRQHNQ